MASKIFLVDGGVDFYCQGHAYNLHLQNPRIQEISSQEHRRMMLLSNEPISIIAEFDNLQQQKHQLQEENRRLYVAIGESEGKNRRLDQLLDITTEE